MKVRKKSYRGPAAGKPAAPPRAATDAEIIALFKQFAAQSRSAAGHLESNLAQIERQAAAARFDTEIRRGREYADEIDLYVARVRSACQQDNSVDAAVNALKLAETWMELRQLRNLAAQREVPSRRTGIARRKATRRS